MSDQVLDAIDNMLKAPIDDLQSSHEQFNTSGRYHPHLIPSKNVLIHHPYHSSDFKH